MKRQLPSEQIRKLRARAQRLGPEQPETDAGGLVRRLFALQAQELASVRLAIRARTRGLTNEEVETARVKERAFVLTWCMRGTLHLVPTEDMGWLLPVFGPYFIQKGERRYRQLGLDADTRLRAAWEIEAAIARGGPQTRAELAEALEAKGIPVEGQAIAHLVRYAAMDGRICFGPGRNGELTYVILEEWVRLGDTLDPAAVTAELARRYLAAHGPAAPEDLARWTGLPLGQARAGFRAIAEELVEIDSDGGRLWMPERYAAWLEDQEQDPAVRLLPRYDGYLLGYRSRDFMVSPQYARKIHPGGGTIRSSLVIDGRAAGLWKRKVEKAGATILVEPFEPIDPGLRPGLEAEALDLGRFLGVETRLKVK